MRLLKAKSPPIEFEFWILLLVARTSFSEARVDQAQRGLMPLCFAAPEKRIEKRGWWRGSLNPGVSSEAQTLMPHAVRALRFSSLTHSQLPQSRE